MNATTIHAAAAGGAAPGPEGQRKLAGGGAKRNHRDQNRITVTPRRGGGTGAWSFSGAPAGARSCFCLSGGSRSLRSLHHRLISIRPSGEMLVCIFRPSLHHRLISIRPPGEIFGPHISLINRSHLHFSSLPKTITPLLPITPSLHYSITPSAHNSPSRHA